MAAAGNCNGVGASASRPDRVSSRSPEKQKIPALLNGRYEIGAKLGSGSYSDVFLGFDKVSEEKVAVKLEWTKAEKGERLLHEAQLYENLGGTNDAPRVRWWGTEADHNIMVMDLLGPSLEDLFCSCGKRFSLKTVLMLAEQMIDRIQYVHSRGIIHRDIKPNNFLMGLGEQSHRVYVMDFGLAKKYLDAAGEHIPCCKKKGLTGTVRYTSRNVHRGLEPSRRDDLGAIGYVLMYFNRGRLPWQGINAKSKKTKQRRIGNRKEQVSHEELCRGYPREFVQYLEHCDALPYTDPPDYDYLRSLIRGVFIREQFELDLRFDWMLPCHARPPLASSDDQKRVKSTEAQKAGVPNAGRSRSRKRGRSASPKVGKQNEGDEEYSYEYGSYEYEEEEEEEEEEEDEEYDYESSEEEEAEERGGGMEEKKENHGSRKEDGGGSRVSRKDRGGEQGSSPNGVGKGVRRISL